MMNAITLSMLLVLLLLLSRSESASAWSSWFSSGDDDATSTATTTTPSELVHPIFHRDIAVTVKAEWKSSPYNVYCEAYGYLGNQILDDLVEVSSYQQATQVITEIASSILSDAELQLLLVNLSLRANAPFCELHNSLAPNLSSSDAVAVVFPGERTIWDVVSFDFQSLSGNNVTNLDEILLPDEVPMNEDGNSSQLVVLYAVLGSRAFRDAFQRVKDSNIRFVVRHMGKEDSKPTTLQGYGVRLDIRNIEYKVFDDTKASDFESSGLVNATELASSSELDVLLAGILAAGLEPSIKAKLLQIHDQQNHQFQKLPPVWQRRQLPLQLSTIVRDSKDPLYTFQNLVQNLPSFASTLVHVKVPDDMIEASSRMNVMTTNCIYLNGRMVANLERPSFNVFELLDQLKVEIQKTTQLQKTLSPYIDDLEILRDIQEAWIQGSNFVSTDDSETADEESSMMPSTTDKAFRIDVGRGWKNSVVYLNDVEKDATYRQWSPSLRQMLMNMQFGMPPSVRRNLFTVLAVIDPLEDPNAGFDFAMQLVQNSYPVRVGTLLVSETDVQDCAEWLKTQPTITSDTACPVTPIFENAPFAIKDLDTIPATTKAIHRLLASFAESYYERPGAVVGYFQFFFSMMEEKTNVSLLDLVELHGDLLEGIQISTRAEGKEAAFSILKGDESKNYSYGKALKFVAEKRLKPGMSFLNGRPLPTKIGDESISKIFGEEQNLIFGWIVNGEITDSSPRSVYAKVLSGDRVFKKNHPLLDKDSDSTTYAFVQHNFDHSALIASGDSDDAAAYFVVDTYLDYENNIDLAIELVSVLDSFPSSIESATGHKTDIDLRFRVLPSTKQAADSKLCLLFANAGALSSSEVLDLLSRIKDTSFDEAVNSLDASLRKALESTEDGPCGNPAYLTEETLVSTSIVVANGRVYDVEGKVEKDDIELLLSLELQRSKAVTGLLRKHLSFSNPADVLTVSLVATLLAVEETDGSLSRGKMGSSLEKLRVASAEKANPLYYNFNNRAGGESPYLQVQAAVLVDPLSEAAQRVTPLLRVMRDHLGLQLELVLTPDSELDSDSKGPISSYYRFVADPTALGDSKSPQALFSDLPANHVLTIRVDTPEPWNVQQTFAVQDTDNLRCDLQLGCGDETSGGEDADKPIHERNHLTRVEYGLKNLLIFGQCYDGTKGSPPNGLQLNLVKASDWKVPHESSAEEEMEVGMDGSITMGAVDTTKDQASLSVYSDTLVMKNVGYWQLPANPGVWKLAIDPNSKGSEIFEMVEGSALGGRIRMNEVLAGSAKTLVMKDFVNKGELLIVKRRPGFESASLFHDDKDMAVASSYDDVINVFSLATGHLYERFLKIMMLSVTKRTSSKVKFWLFENFLSPKFKSSATAMAERIGCEVEFVTYKWPEWLRGQSEKQRIIWGYKILFLDVLFPLSVKKIIYVDADQVVRGDLKELWDMDLKGAPYGYTPMCSSRETTLGFQFWNTGFWKNHLRGKPYHISALYVVDLAKFRHSLVGDQLRSIYQQLSADPNSLANLDQDLPNYAQHQVPIFSLPQEWLWCESWCSDETKETAKTIDLCNNPLHKEPKVSMAKRIISGKLFNESWVELDAEVERYETEYYGSLADSTNLGEDRP